MAEDISIQVEDIPREVQDLLDSTLETAIEELTREAKDLRRVYSRMKSGGDEIFSLHALYAGQIGGEDHQVYTEFSISFNDAIEEARCNAKYSVNKMVKS